MRPRMTDSSPNAPSTTVAARGDMSTRSQVPSTVPPAPKSVSTAIRRATAAKSPSRNSCRASMTMFGMIRTATALLTSITSASSGVARGGKPKLMAPLTRAARSTAAALRRAAGMRHPTLTPFFDVAHHPEGFDHDAGVRPRRRHSDAYAGSLGVGLRRGRGRRVSDVRLRPGGDGQAREGRHPAHARRLPVLHAPSRSPHGERNPAKLADFLTFQAPREYKIRYNARVQYDGSQRERAPASPWCLLLPPLNSETASSALQRPTRVRR